MKRQKKSRKDIETLTDIISSSELNILKLGIEFLPVIEKWREIMGEEFYSQTSFSGYRKGIFYIKVPDNATMNRLVYEKDRILKKLKEIISPQLIEDIFFEYEGDIGKGKDEIKGK